MEQHSLNQLNLLHPKIRAIAIQAYNEAVKATPSGVHPYIDQTYRTLAESAKLYAQGRTEPGEIITNAKPGESWHNWALALDFHLIINGKDSWDVSDDWMTVVNIFKSHGFNWGGNFLGNFKDYPHLENKLGETLTSIQSKWNAGETFTDSNGMTYVKI